jgi:2-polyprenyl-3-methyl-5-hydroxy-6-metoxy-1,4-benzoquinol methylase
MNEFKYSGEELDVFEQATNWKAYWSDLIRPHIGINVLEVGAGIGTNTLVLKDGNYDRWVCIEPDSLLCEKIVTKRDSGVISQAVDVKNSTLYEISVDNKFDTILYIDVLEHIENDREELEMAANLLTDSGKIIIISPAHNFLFSPFDQKIGHFRRYNKNDLIKLAPHSTTIIEIKYMDSIGFFASFANKLILKKSDPTHSQIAFWDSLMVPVSRWVDPILLHSAGKSILVTLQKG